MTDDCLFCRIINGVIPCTKMYEDEEVLAFRDVNPQAPLHVLVIPKKHIAMISDLTEEDHALIGKLHDVANNIVKESGHREDGYRLVLNCGAGAGQTVFHIHLHVLAGRTFSWPPG
jgi:histidine triad (HIT) family protein